MRKVDVIIIGGGILGWVLAHLMTKSRGIREAMIISSPFLHTASLHNQSWLQSGLIYDLRSSVGRQEALMCMLHGRKLLDLRDIAITEKFGVMAVASRMEAREKADFLRKYGFPQYGAILKPKEVTQLLGMDFSRSGHFDEGTCFIKTPDQPFDEGGMMRFCKASVRVSPFPFQSVEGIASIQRNKAARNGYSVTVNGEEFDPGVSFVLAGVNTLRLMQPLGIEGRLNLTARRCVLMQALIHTDLIADLFMDTPAHLNINTVTDLWRQKRYLIGDILNSPVLDLTQALTNGKVTEEDKKNLLENFCSELNYPHLRSRLMPFMADDANFSVCYKVESQGHLPWIFDASDFDPALHNLYIAGSGKATLAAYAAHQLLDRAKIGKGAQSAREIIELTDNALLMWFEQQMKEL